VRRFGGLALSLALAACAPTSAPLPKAPIPAGPAIGLNAEPVGLNAEPPPNWTFAGGLALTSPDTARLHGLSDIEVDADGGLTAVSDDGDLFTARLVLDGQRRLTGVADGRLAPLRDPDGGPIGGKEWGDAEGLAIGPGGDLFVSFERRHRIWLYHRGEPALRLPAPEAAFPDNGGMEALSLDRSRGVGVYVTAGEDSGETWTCRIAATCVQGPTIEKSREFGVVGLRKLPDGRGAWLLRAFDPVRGVRIELRVFDARGVVLDRLSLARPALVDNFEGVAAVPGPDGSIRFYLISDDNFSAGQKTLLYAFDWRPPTGR
jgi:hypothetical protein